MQHARGLAAIANPTVNSYKRLLSGLDAPYMINWATKGEKALINIESEPDDVKVEIRFPDGAANPYLLFATCIAAGLDGIDKQISPGDELATDTSSFGHLPDDLKEALEELGKDEIVKGALGSDFTDIYTKIKRDEWNDFISEVTEWEIRNYLAKL